MSTWDASRGVYLSDTNIIPREVVRQLLEKSTLYTEERLAKSASARLYNNLRQIIKEEYIRQYLVGIGGRDRMTARNWGSLGGMLKQQYGFLRTFIQEILSQDLDIEKVHSRLNMYARSAREAHTRARARVTAALGYEQVAWMMNTTAQHCQTCLRRSESGYIQAGKHGGFMDGSDEVFPADSTSECYSNDRCWLSYRKSDGQEYLG